MSLAIHWFRRDLRLEDNTALFHALKSGSDVRCIFIFDTSILDKLEDENDARVTFIYKEIERLKAELKKLGSDLWVYYGNPIDIWLTLLTDYNIKSIYTNKDYEPYAIKRDNEVKQLAGKHQIAFYDFKDHVIFEESEVLKDDGNPYVVFTPYSRKWKHLLQTNPIEVLDTTPYFSSFESKESAVDIPTLIDMGFKESLTTFPSRTTTQGKVKNYEKNRNFPAIQGTTKLSVHFRFGTISIRAKALKALSTSETWLNELIWRDFYIQILYHYPHVVGNSFRAKYDAIQWRNNESDFEKWCTGKTGYPIVDAGMRELNKTGFMHNRVRMIVASFLTKHLLIDWRWGEAYFARQLLDFELASNNGGWQWASGSGVDAAPYFRIFNPYTQQTKFDKEFKYVKQWVKEFGTTAYPKPIVDHKIARERCLATYKGALV